MNYTKGEQLYEGKAKKVFATNDPQVYIVDYKDDATAFNGLKKGTIVGKGVINNKVSNFMMKQLAEKANIPTHFIEQISDRETLVRKVSIVPLEVIVRNVCAGSMAKRYGVAEGTPLARPAMEFSFKNDDLGDPMINDDYAIALNLATEEEIATIRQYAFAVNEFMKAYLLELGIKLIDFKLEFGKTDSGEIILADEISPDTCRFWDVKTNEKLDKDRFRRDLGDVESAYHEILHRLMGE
ncbi:phosphoribosylaminoimidazolesuccinocarboxamide synthase [Oscillospiraceae bacterium LTW-04]|nr:phosphoribosylaminoimidazolesuccinocarboxamide synthase [Oscillospiraceae bacterium MB24-C1]